MRISSLNISEFSGTISRHVILQTQTRQVGASQEKQITRKGEIIEYLKQKLVN